VWIGRCDVLVPAQDALIDPGGQAQAACELGAAHRHEEPANVVVHRPLLGAEMSVGEHRPLAVRMEEVLLMMLSARPPARSVGAHEDDRELEAFRLVDRERGHGSGGQFVDLVLDLVEAS